MDESTYIALCEEHLAAFHRMACSILHHQADAEDAVQQALMKAWRLRGKARPGLEKAWVMRIVINESISLLRRRRRALPTEEIRIPAAQVSGEETALHTAIRTLPESLRTPLLLKYMEGMTEKEVAAALQLSLTAVKNRLFRARRALQKQLNEEVSP
ncbi:MAG: RNA polymerase sigma factor [Clostridia bacterium]|nr:RNA polymerase sigma factor [Clostridia bacterium]